MGIPYQNTISGLIQKRSEVIAEIHAMRERMGVLANDLQCIDRVLQALGHSGHLGDVPDSGTTKMVLFHKSELQQHLLRLMRNEGRPLSSRDLAVLIATADGRDRYDRRLLLDVIKRVGKAMATLRKRGLVLGSRSNAGVFEWRLHAAQRVDSTPRIG